MRGKFRERLQEMHIKYMSEYFKRIRKEKGLTQEKMAELLRIDTRSYQMYENGSGLCGFSTFVILLFEICPDKGKLLKDLYDIIIEVWTNEAA